MEWPDKCVAALPKGTFARIVAVLAKGEDRTEFLRAAVEAELNRRGNGTPIDPARTAKKEAKGK